MACPSYLSKVQPSNKDHPCWPDEVGSACEYTNAPRQAPALFKKPRSTKNGPVLTVLGRDEVGLSARSPVSPHVRERYHEADTYPTRQGNSGLHPMPPKQAPRGKTMVERCSRALVSPTPVSQACAAGRGKRHRPCRVRFTSRKERSAVPPPTTQPAGVRHDACCRVARLAIRIAAAHVLAVRQSRRTGWMYTVHAGDATPGAEVRCMFPRDALAENLQNPPVGNHSSAGRTGGSKSFRGRSRDHSGMAELEISRQPEDGDLARPNDDRTIM